MAENYFEILNNINVSDKIEKKNGLSYLSWAYAWGELKKRYPDATYTIYENPDGWFYFTDGRTCWVKTGVTVQGIEHIEYLPVMDFKNKSIPVDAVTSFDVNKAIQRSLTKAVARHGLGLYIYAGEDLPEEEAKPKAEKKPVQKKAEEKKAEEKKPEEKPVEIDTSTFRGQFKAYVYKNKLDNMTITKILTDCGLKPDSPDEDWETGLLYARSVVLAQEG